MEGSFSIISVRAQLHVIAEQRNTLIMNIINSKIASAMANQSIQLGWMIPSSQRGCSTVKVKKKEKKKFIFQDTIFGQKSEIYEILTGSVARI